MTRDIASVKPGEHVVVRYHAKPHVFEDGVFKGVTRNGIMVDHTVGFHFVPFGSPRAYVTDSNDQTLTNGSE